MTGPPDPDLSSAALDAHRASLRGEMLARRRGLSPGERARRSVALTARLQTMEVLDAPGTVLAYNAMPSEADPGGFVAHLLDSGVVVALPRVVEGSDRTLDLHIFGPGDRLVTSGAGVSEPLDTAPRVDRASIAVALVPGLVYDICGNRLGFGEGYYDRLLSQLPRALKLGICFDFQLVDSLPAAAHDVSMDRLVTDARSLRCGPPGEGSTAGG